MGTHAALVASGTGAQITVLERSADRIRELVATYDQRFTTDVSDEFAIAPHAACPDVIVGAVLLPQAQAPRLVTLEMDLRE